MSGPRWDRLMSRPRLCILNGPLPIFMVSTGFSVPSKKYCFVFSNDFKRAYVVEPFIDIAAGRLGEIRPEMKFADIKPKRRKSADED